LALARQITDWLSDAKAEDVVLLDVHKATYITDYFVVATATSERQMAALADRIRQQAKDEGIPPGRVEGTPDSGWLLLDFGDVILHIFSPALRDFYRIERVWSDTTTVVRVM
jgi:ribosome-associated protein